jgi:hypothetical protein
LIRFDPHVQRKELSESIVEPSDAHKSFPFDSSDDDGPDYSREEDALKNRERKYKKGRIS